MGFQMPAYHHPDFSQPQLVSAPDARWEIVEQDGVAPEHFHSTSMYPEYFKLDGQWCLAEESRMDACVVVCDDGKLAVIEPRNLKKGDKVILGRTETGEEGIFLHNNGCVPDGIQTCPPSLHPAERSRYCGEKCPLLRFPFCPR